MFHRRFKTLSVLQKRTHYEKDALTLKLKNCSILIEETDQQLQNFKNVSREEEKIASTLVDVSLSHSLSHFRELNKQEVIHLEQKKINLQKEYAHLRDQLTVFLAEEKVFEKMLESLKLEQSMLEKQKENQFLDELASQKWQKITQNNKII